MIWLNIRLCVYLKLKSIKNVGWGEVKGGGRAKLLHNAHKRSLFVLFVLLLLLLVFLLLSHLLLSS